MNFIYLNNIWSLHQSQIVLILISLFCIIKVPVYYNCVENSEQQFFLAPNSKKSSFFYACLFTADWSLISKHYKVTQLSFQCRQSQAVLGWIQCRNSVWSSYCCEFSFFISASASIGMSLDDLSPRALLLIPSCPPEFIVIVQSFSPDPALSQLNSLFYSRKWKYYATGHLAVENRAVSRIIQAVSSSFDSLRSAYSAKIKVPSSRRFF